MGSHFPDCPSASTSRRYCSAVKTAVCQALSQLLSARSRVQQIHRVDDYFRFLEVPGGRVPLAKIP